jgi:antitoxin (DNA-binding transcriptional repressor) of toxin-antitoxin stability system
MAEKMEIDIEAAADVLEELMDALANGTITAVVLTRNGTAAARLVSIDSGTNDATDPD